MVEEGRGVAGDLGAEGDAAAGHDALAERRLHDDGPGEHDERRRFTGDGAERIGGDDRVEAFLRDLHVGQRERGSGLPGQIHAVELPLVGDGRWADGGDAQGDVAAGGQVGADGRAHDGDAVHDLHSGRGGGDDFEGIADHDGVRTTLVEGEIIQGECSTGGAGEIGAVELPLENRGDREGVGRAQGQAAAGGHEGMGGRHGGRGAGADLDVVDVTLQRPSEAHKSDDGELVEGKDRRRTVKGQVGTSDAGRLTLFAPVEVVTLADQINL